MASASWWARAGVRLMLRQCSTPAGSTGPSDLVIADRGFWSVEFVHAFTTAGAHLLAGLQSNHLGTTQADLPDGSRLSLMRPGKEVRLRAAREGRVLPKEIR
ncbi:hypothetical protein ACFY0A_29320 [Streptomyces sp. NPDC001698]